MRLTFLGSGTSAGVPEIGCDCEVCRSDDPRDARYRCSVWLTHGDLSVVVDTGPEFRLQVLRAGITRLDAVLMTHLHADHIFGLDDVRKFNRLQESHIPIYLPSHMEARFRQLFPYALDETPTTMFRPKLDLRPIELEAWEMGGGLRIQPLDVEHSHERIFGYQFSADGRRAAYLTDCKVLSPESEALVRGADLLVLGALWKTDWSHSGHLNLAEAIAYARHLEAKQVYFTHITHWMGLHAETDAELPAGMGLGYDGLAIDLS